MVSHIHAFVRVRPLLPREFAQSTSEAVSVYEVLVECAVFPKFVSSSESWWKSGNAAFTTSNDMQDHRIRACKDNTVLESNFDKVLGQDATQTQVFEAGQGETALRLLFTVYAWVLPMAFWTFQLVRCQTRLADCRLCGLCVARVQWQHPGIVSSIYADFYCILSPKGPIGTHSAFVAVLLQSLPLRLFGHNSLQDIANFFALTFFTLTAVSVQTLYKRS